MPKTFFSYTDQGVERLKWHKLERYFAADAGAASRQDNMVVKFRLRVRSDRETLFSSMQRNSFNTIFNMTAIVKQIVCRFLFASQNRQ